MAPPSNHIIINNPKMNYTIEKGNAVHTLKSRRLDGGTLTLHIPEHLRQKKNEGGIFSGFFSVETVSKVAAASADTNLMSRISDFPSGVWVSESDLTNYLAKEWTSYFKEKGFVADDKEPKGERLKKLTTTEISKIVKQEVVAAKKSCVLEDLSAVVRENLLAPVKEKVLSTINTFYRNANYNPLDPVNYADYEAKEDKSIEKSLEEVLRDSARIKELLAAFEEDPRGKEIMDLVSTAETNSMRLAREKLRDYASDYSKNKRLVNQKDGTESAEKSIEMTIEQYETRENEIWEEALNKIFQKNELLLLLSEDLKGNEIVRAATKAKADSTDVESAQRAKEKLRDYTREVIQNKNTSPEYQELIEILEQALADQMTNLENLKLIDGTISQETLDQFKERAVKAGDENLIVTLSAFTTNANMKHIIEEEKKRALHMIQQGEFNVTGILAEAASKDPKVRELIELIKNEDCEAAEKLREIKNDAGTLSMPLDFVYFQASLAFFKHMAHLIDATLSDLEQCAHMADGLKKDAAFAYVLSSTKLGEVLTAYKKATGSKAYYERDIEAAMAVLQAIREKMVALATNRVPGSKAMETVRDMINVLNNPKTNETYKINVIKAKVKMLAEYTKKVEGGSVTQARALKGDTKNRIDEIRSHLFNESKTDMENLSLIAKLVMPLRNAIVEEARIDDVIRNKDLVGLMKFLFVEQQVA